MLRELEYRQPLVSWPAERKIRWEGRASRPGAGRFTLFKGSAVSGFFFFSNFEVVERRSMGSCLNERGFVRLKAARQMFQLEGEAIGTLI